ncbi:helix-turn-helix domain-containing protein [Nonomuraea sp. NPDC050310]|uniref:ArsR/SmtB family transcription factor n=1 Tax=Nonomuraea sp. NPDC050310 TaxID=3154935 RepID=UPI0034070756
MIDVHLGPDDLARIRFARSPLAETVASVQVLGDPSRQEAFRPWLASVTPLLGGLRLELLGALVGGPHFSADFLTPAPEVAGAEFEAELERVRATPAAEVRASIDELRGDGPVPERLAGLYDGPERELGRLAEELAAYWRVAVRPVWPRLRALADADLGYRAQAVTTGGLAKLLADLHPGIERGGPGMRILTPAWDGEHLLRGCGLVLVPCVFAWPRLVMRFDEPRPSMFAYPPRGFATVWDRAPRTRGEPLGELIGHSRARLLAHLDLPLSTTQLAAEVGLTPAAVSQHLSVLRRTSLVTSRRDGRAVLYQRTSLATELLRQTG